MTNETHPRVCKKSTFSWAHALSWKASLTNYTYPATRMGSSGVCSEWCVRFFWFHISDCVPPLPSLYHFYGSGGYRHGSQCILWSRSLWSYCSFRRTGTEHCYSLVGSNHPVDCWSRSIMRLCSGHWTYAPGNKWPILMSNVGLENPSFQPRTCLESQNIFQRRVVSRYFLISFRRTFSISKVKVCVIWRILLANACRWFVLSFPSVHGIRKNRLRILRPPYYPPSPFAPKPPSCCLG